MYLAELVDGISRREKVENVEFEEKVDVVVAGLGTAGAIAAIEAATRGAKVLGIERINMCGGTATAGGVFGYYFGLPGGRFEEVDQRAREMREATFVEGGHFHPDAKGIVLEKMISEAGGKISYESSVVGAYFSNDDEIRGVKTITPQGVVNIECEILIDATGDGEICAIAGASYTLGREMDSQPQPFSSVRVFMRDGKISMSNFDAGYTAPTDAKNLSQSILKANSLHMECDHPLLWITTIPGGREGRLIECDTRLTFESFIKTIEAEQDDCPRPLPVAYCYSNFDSHSQDWALEDDIAKDWMVAASLWGMNFTFAVPLEAMIVKGFKNLMAAGRCLSVDHIMASALRMQRGMQKLGQAAGLAAAMAVSEKTDLRSLDSSRLRDILKEDKCLDDSNLPDCSFPAEIDELRELLKSSSPGKAIWTTANRINEYKDFLLECLGSSDKNCSRNSAIALGIAEYGEALPVLRDIIAEREDFIPETSRSHNQGRLHGALHLVGKVKDEENIATLMKFVESHNDLTFQEMSHAVVSLLNLGDYFTENRHDIARFLENFMKEERFDDFKLLLKNSSNSREAIFEPMANLIRLITIRQLEKWRIPNSIMDCVDTTNLTWREKQMIPSTREN